MLEGLAVAGPSEDAAKVIACFEAGNDTVQSMYACSGRWVTPRALLFCILQSDCPILADNPAQRATLDASLGGDQRHTKLTLEPANLVKFPAAAQIDECNKKESNGDAFLDCTLNAMAAAPPGLLQCAAITDDRARAGCLFAIANDPDIIQAARCFDHVAGAADFLACLDNSDFARQVRTLTSCLDTPDGRPADCLAPGAGAADASLIDCAATPGLDGLEAAKCLDGVSPDLSKVHQTVTCLKAPASDVFKCGIFLASAPTAKVIDCLSHVGEPRARATCVMASVPDFAAIGPVESCVKQSLKGPRLSDCVTPALRDDTMKFVTCMSWSARAKVDKCLSSLGPKMAAAMRDIPCIVKTIGMAKSLACVSAELGSDAQKIVACASGDQSKLLPCLVGNRPDYEVAERVYACVDGGRNAEAIIENCTGGLIGDERTRRAASCLAGASGDRERAAVCAAVAVLPADAARYASCAANGDGATSFVLCSLGTTMNEEWRIAADCAIRVGGNPTAYAACTSGRLMVRELKKCFGGKVGKDCFEPDNAVMAGLRDAVRDFPVRSDKNAAIVAEVSKIGRLAGGPNSLVNDPTQISARNSVFHSPGKTFGNDNLMFHNPRQIAKIPAGGQSVVYQVSHAKLR
jgi:hypothetical protein